MKRVARAFSSFLAVGAVCTAVQYAILLTLVQAVRLNATLASSIGFALSAVLNYALNYRFTYQATTRHVVSFPRFVAVAVGGLGLNAAIMYTGENLLGMHYILAQVVATAIVLVWNFLANLRWSFSHRTG